MVLKSVQLEVDQAITLIGLPEIEAAARRISGYVRPSPIVHMPSSGLLLKAENLHITGAFKIRGAFNSILSLPERRRRGGIVAHSSGNHAQAVAYAAHVLEVPAVIVMPSDAPPTKLEGVRRWNPEIVLVGTASGERRDTAAALAATHGYTEVPPYDADAILAATGTIGLELDMALDSIDAVFAPIGGGGLIGGLAAALKTLRPNLQVIGVEPELAADAYESFIAGRLVELPAAHMGRTAADGLRVQRLGRRNWAHLCAYVDEILTVSEEQILAAIRLIARESHLIAEPSGATAVAGALASSHRLARSLAILSGGNIEMSLFADVIRDVI